MSRFERVRSICKNCLLSLLNEGGFDGYCVECYVKKGEEIKKLKEAHALIDAENLRKQQAGYLEDVLSELFVYADVDLNEKYQGNFEIPQDQAQALANYIIKLQSRC